MIPKIIHYSWFSGEPFPENIQQMMATWKQVLPDYEFRLWDAESLKSLDMPFANEAIAEKKWAFAADQLRIYAVYTYGGIWLDTDVEVFMSFDPFLSHRFFIGHEEVVEYHAELSQQLITKLTAHCFGAEAGHPFLKRCMEYYEGRHFITATNRSLPAEMRQDQRVLPDIMAMLARDFGYTGHPFSIYEKETCREDMHIYPAHYFDGPKYHSMEQVVCIHQCLSAWRDVNWVASRTTQKKNWMYYVHKAVEGILRRKRIFMKMYYVG